MRMTFNPNDLDAMQKLMDEYGRSKILFYGENAEHESMHFTISNTNIDCVTYQHDGRKRFNTYWRDGAREEEIGERWRPEGGEREDWIMVVLNEEEVRYASVVALMDDEIREELHAEMAPCTEQEFLDAYIARHAEKFDGEEFVI